MKRILALLLVLSVLLAVSACGGPVDDPIVTLETEPATELPTTEAPTTEPPATELPTTEPSATDPSAESHVHNYAVLTVKSATCTEKGYTFYICSCGVNYLGDYTDATGHTWEDASCTQPQTCETCHITEGEAMGHDWADASCSNPRKCSNCELTEGVALPHDMSDATCTSPPICKVCGYCDGDPAFHNFKRSPSDCTKDICTECGEEWHSGNDHDFWFTSCVTPSKCLNCDVTDGKIPGHHFKNGKCTRCKAVENAPGSTDIPTTEPVSDVRIISDTQTISNLTIDTDVYITSTGVVTFNNVTVNGNIYCYGKLTVSSGSANNLYAYYWDLGGITSSCNAWDGTHGLIKGAFKTCENVTIKDGALDYAFNKWGKK